MLQTTAQANITNWRQFSALVRSREDNLLRRLDEFPNAVLVAGCQRSGTTMLARILTQSAGMVDYWVGRDDELDAALILSGEMPHEPRGRYCFQTTYVNDRYHEYFDHMPGIRLIWLVRSPYAVVYSMLYNWKEAALTELFEGCGVPVLDGKDRWIYRIKGNEGISLLHQACWSYNGKTSQLFALRQRFSTQKMMVVDYDDLVQRKERILPAIYDFIDLPYTPEYADKIHSQSLNKIKNLTKREKDTIMAICQPVYRQTKMYTASEEFLGERS